MILKAIILLLFFIRSPEHPVSGDALEDPSARENGMHTALVLPDLFSPVRALPPPHFSFPPPTIFQQTTFVANQSSQPLPFPTSWNTFVNIAR
jgi:hypothetical protein